MFALLKNLFLREKVDLEALLKEEALILDVRSPGEFASGHASGSINVPLGELPHHLAYFPQNAQPIIVCCRSGVRAASAVTSLQKAGIAAVNAGAWQNVEQANRK